MNTSTVRAVDLFCGAGGTSTGLYNSCREAGREVDLLAINHWKVAIESHTANHPGARHICERLEAIRPEDVIAGRHLDIMVASPECTHHSIARGGRPVLDQLRASAWLLLRWIETLRIDSVLIENVKEFRQWGPTGVNGKPLKSRKGETYQAFLNALRSFGYAVEDRVLNAADYGDPTTRQRLFIMARKGRKPIIWPEATHGQSALLGTRQPYRTAREIIDWSLKGQSIFNRKKPLAPATMARIAAGLKKFGGKEAEPFLVPFFGERKGQKPRSHSVDEPLPTITGHGAGALIEPFITKYYGTGRTQSVDQPLDTITTKDRFGLVEVTGKYQIDIRFRMLQPHELAAAMSFPKGYQLRGTKEHQVKQIGNAVPVCTAQALCRSLLEVSW